ncbi:MAG TPA: porin [Planctomycetota bacterium]
MTLLAALLLSSPQADVDAGYDGGFYVRGKDAKLTLEGLLQVNGVFFEPDAAHESEFVLRKMRLEFSGEFFERWRFHVEPDFSEDGVELEEAWVGFQIDTHRFMLGRMKEPFSLEEIQSRRHMDLINFSILNQFAPAEDHGITINGSFDILEYGVGFYNGTGSDDTTSDKDGALRLVLHPWRGLQFGGAVTAGRQETDLSGEELRTEARVPWASYVAGTEVEDERVRVGAEAAFLEGPFAAQAELIRVREELNETTVHFTGGYVQASYVLTGEGKAWKGDRVRAWKGVNPARPFLKDPDLGAWQLVARFSRLALDDALAPFVTSFPDRIDSVTFGVTWYANEFVKVKANYLRTVYEEPIVVSGKRHDNEDTLIVQFQVMF